MVGDMRTEPAPLCQTSATVYRIEEPWDLDAPPVDFVAWEAH
jgi:hypothetical protein